MTAPKPLLNERLRPFGTTIFSEMSRLAGEHSAINLSQGFPDFDGPPEIIDAAIDAMRGGDNQYSRSLGHPRLVQAVAEMLARRYDLLIDPMTEVGVTCGATEGIAAALLGMLNPGDEVIVFEPFYDSYLGCLAMAGATPKIYTLRFPDFAVDADRLAALFTDRTRLLILNTPHNPTGKVFSRSELELIAQLCDKHNVTVLSDEVYEFLTFDDAEHIPFASLPGMRDRTLTLSSNSKTFSYTGWKIGWCYGPAALVAASQAAHQFLTFCAATPLQVAVAAGLEVFAASGDYLDTFRSEYQERRDLVVAALTAAGFDVATPQGTYFVLAAFDKLWDGDDRSFAYHLTKTVGVTPVPPSVFYRNEVADGARLLRFAFCKQLPTLQSAATKLAALAP
ncbi:MAG: aminotransferase class I/II-fold pyridoxal phosphate-dependent enzyme [Planctomycetota bacterium]